ncbi:ABC-2 transporter permease [Clostridium sp. CM028]|uniref:ABC-2 transporter permease n=1 Tax=unclassified Clostridium TaxID=2614128 RepID=UPI001C6F3727|nr:ABC-2 transporter permease [Clostridium sp. CM027]MBW9148075.1 ABC-2 transporter permease [Clostridium sp. CM028]WAG69814.1 ABC-2 transporter permease [Clostridium sp. CF011]
MLKKLLNYQTLLSYSSGIASTENSLKSSFFTVFIYVLFLFTLSLILDAGGLVFCPIFFTLHAVYYTINSQNKLFEIVPVPKLYSIINIYLFVLVKNLCFTVGITLGLILTGLSPQSTDVLDMISLANNWKAVLVTSCISTIIASVLLPIFFIRLNPLRKALTISIVTLVTIALLLFENALPVSTEFGTLHFLESIATMPHYNEFLLLLVCVCVVIIPISMLISYRLYKGKRCLVC